MLHGFGGSILRVNLTTGEISRSPTPKKLAREWLGGRGFVSRILYDEVPRDADPLGPDNRFVIAAGPMSGVYVPAGSKCEFGAISPATNAAGDSNMGGLFGPELKYAGYDAVIVQGIAEEPTCLLIEDDETRLVPAADLWGKGALEAEAALKEQLGESWQISTIGPAGENKVHFACISHYFGRQAGRCGIGAVMGSKRLKAVAVRGTGRVPISDPKGLAEHTRSIIKRTMDHPLLAPWAKYGTAMFVGWSNEHATFPTRNFSTSQIEGWEKIDGGPLREKHVIRDKACFGCWMRCGKYSKAQAKGRDEVRYEGPEYESTALLGGNLGFTDLDSVGHLNHLADDLGLDTISAGSVAAFAIECFEKGLISSDDLGGRSLGWGDLDGAEHLLNLIARREGIGDLLAEGVRTASKKLGQGSERFAVQTKGLEWSGYESRWAPAMMLSYATSDIGAHHNRSWTITIDVELGRDVVKGKAGIVAYLQHIRPLFDMLCVCRLQWGELDITPDEYAESFNLVSGWNYSLADMLRLSERVWNLNRAHFLLRNGGPGRSHDTVPARFLEEPVPSGPAEGKMVAPEAFATMLDEYYAARGWDGSGNPTGELLADLGLEREAEELRAAGVLGEPIPGGIPTVRGSMMKPKAM